MRLPQSQHPLLDLLRHLVAMSVRRAALFYQPGYSRFAVSSQPHIPGLARDLIPLAEFGHGAFLQLVLEDKAKFFFHHTARFPWHALVLHAIAKVAAVSGMLPVYSVRDVPGPYQAQWEPPPPGVLHNDVIPCGLARHFSSSPAASTV